MNHDKGMAKAIENWKRRQRMVGLYQADRAYVEAAYNLGLAIRHVALLFVAGWLSWRSNIAGVQAVRSLKKYAELLEKRNAAIVAFNRVADEVEQIKELCRENQ